MNVDKVKNRVQFFDIARGIAIICIILGHLGNPFINRVVFTFHVSIFFFITGYFMNSKQGMKEYTRNKIRTLIIPYIVTCVVMIIIGTLEGFIQGDAVGALMKWSYAAIYGAGDSYSEPFYIPAIGAIWFLWAAFWGGLCLRGSLYFKRHIRLGVIILLFIAGYYTRRIFWFPLSIQAGACAALFMYIGYICRNAKDSVGELPAEVRTFGLAFAAVIWFAFMKNFQSFWLVHCDIGRGVIDIFGSICACIVVIYISRIIEIKCGSAGKFLAFLGRYSLLVLCVHIIELNLFPWWAIARKLVEMGMPEFCQLWLIIAGKLTADLGCTYVISRMPVIRKIFGYGPLSETGDMSRKKMGIDSDVKNKGGQMSDKKARVQYWDMAKGFTILLVIIGHISNVNLYLRGIIFSFHMPFYFIANGYFIKNYSIGNTVKKSAKSLLIPYSVVCLISTVWYTAKNWQWTEMGENLVHIRNKLVAMVMGISNSSTIFKNVDSVWLVWFVICLFAARVIYVAVMWQISRFRLPIQVAVILLISAVGIVVGKRCAFLPWSLDVALASLPFLMAGEYLAKYDLLGKRFKITMLVSAIIWAIPLGLKMHIELATRVYPMGLVSVFEAIGGSMCVVGFFYWLEKRGVKCGVLSWLGRNSMVILAVHCLEMMYFDWDKYVFRVLPVANVWWMAATVKVVGIVAVAWMVVMGREMVKGNLKTE